MGAAAVLGLGPLTELHYSFDYDDDYYYYHYFFSNNVSLNVMFRFRNKLTINKPIICMHVIS